MAIRTEIHLFYWKQDSGGWYSIKATKNKSKGHLSSSTSMDSLHPEENIPTMRSFIVYSPILNLSPSSNLYPTQGTHITTKTKVRSLIRKYNRGWWYLRVLWKHWLYNSTLINLMWEFQSNFVLMSFQTLFLKLAKLQFGTSPCVPPEQNHILTTPEVSGRERSQTPLPVILINNPILIKHWLAAN